MTDLGGNSWLTIAQLALAPERGVTQNVIAVGTHKFTVTTQRRSYGNSFDISADHLGETRLFDGDRDVAWLGVTSFVHAEIGNRPSAVQWADRDQEGRKVVFGGVGEVPIAVRKPRLAPFQQFRSVSITWGNRVLRLTGSGALLDESKTDLAYLKGDNKRVRAEEPTLAVLVALLVATDIEQLITTKFRWSGIDAGSIDFSS